MSLLTVQALRKRMEEEHEGTSQKRDISWQAQKQPLWTKEGGIWVTWAEGCPMHSGCSEACRNFTFEVPR